MDKVIHKCDGGLPSDGYGEALSYCTGYEDGTLWVGNGEYASRVNYCPFCGSAAAKQMRFVWVKPQREGWSGYWESVEMDGSKARK